MARGKIALNVEEATLLQEILEGDLDRSTKTGERALVTSLLIQLSKISKVPVEVRRYEPGISELTRFRLGAALKSATSGGKNG